METLNRLWHLPMLWDVIVPVSLLLLFVMFLVWDSSSHLPIEKRMMHRLRKARRDRHTAHV